MASNQKFQTCKEAGKYNPQQEGKNHQNQPQMMQMIELVDKNNKKLSEKDKYHMISLICGV